MFDRNFDQIHAFDTLQTHTQTQNYNDNLATVAKEYLRSGALFFDVFTSIPVSYFEFFAIQACGMSMSDCVSVFSQV
jgi:hypothetical protein